MVKPLTHIDERMINFCLIFYLFINICKFVSCETDFNYKTKYENQVLFEVLGLNILQSYICFVNF